VSSFDHLWNDMPQEQREKLGPYMRERQILHLQQARAVLVNNHKRALKEIDDWIANIHRGTGNEWSLDAERTISTSNRPDKP
jgi:hypothetical protein